MERPALRLGILGAGQLAAMTAEAALAAGLRPRVLAASRDDPAARAGFDAALGDASDAAVLDAFLADCDVATLENEFLDVEALRAGLAGRPAVRFSPNPGAVALAQDKLLQKRLFARLGIATAEFVVLPPGPWRPAPLARRFPEGYVLKWSRFGYDGRGNLPVFAGAAPDAAAVHRFLAEGRAAGARVYAERRVAYETELAIGAARGEDGDLVFLPLVETRQEDGTCREVRGPAAALGFDRRLERRARRALAALATHLDFRGVLTLELFLAADGRLLANEMAPRVHNSGHYSRWPGEASQFDLHVAAVAGRPLPRPVYEGIVLMRNVLGPDLPGGEAPCPAPTEAPPAGTELCWYGKQTVRRGRKMGHLTGRAATLSAARRLAREMAEWETRFWSGSDRLRKDHHGTAEAGGARRRRDGFLVGSADPSRGR